LACDLGFILSEDRKHVSICIENEAIKFEALKLALNL